MAIFGGVAYGFKALPSKKILGMTWKKKISGKI
jgi:hypothetical protein